VSPRKLAEPVAVLAAIILVVVLSAVAGPGSGARPVLDRDQLQRLYEPFDWSQEGVPPQPGSPASTVADFVTCLQEARWEDASSLVVPMLRSTRDGLYFQPRFGPVIDHLDSWLLLKETY